MNILNNLQDIFRDVFDEDSLILTKETSPNDIEDWDSLAQITLISEIEKAFNYRFSLKTILELKNVGDVLDLLDKHLEGEL